ncbi:hypothetical protein FD08_GL004647 [Lentilactobacillus parakefiri DSM 10551]|nr:hypothetical protein FD08_GL004647 [Lentilactobacillus parakefiri DSM 10551]
MDDQLHILTDSQKEQIAAENEKLSHKPTKQQIWFISTDKTPSDFDKVNSPLDLETISESGFSLLNLQQATLDFVNDLTSEYTDLNQDSDDPTEKQAFNEVGDYVTIILVAPNFKYSVMPLLSGDSQVHISDVRDFIMTRQLNFKDDSQANVMHTVNFVSAFLNTKATNKDDDGGITFGELVWILIGLVVVLGIVHHIRHRNDPHKPFGISPEMDDASAKYDNGWLDGVYYGENSGDDSFKN